MGIDYNDINHLEDIEISLFPHNLTKEFNILINKRKFEQALLLCEKLINDPTVKNLDYSDGEKYSVYEKFNIPMKYYTPNDKTLFNNILNLKLYLDKRFYPEDIDFCDTRITDKMEYAKKDIWKEYHRQFYSWSNESSEKYSNILLNAIDMNIEEFIYTVDRGNVFINFLYNWNIIEFTRKIWREAENNIRVKNNLPKVGEGWISEIEVLKITKELFPDYEIIHQASPHFLGNQRFDVYIKELKVAIEYQGEQHFKPISLFGGKKGFKNTKERDERKKKLCDDNGIFLYYVNYDDNKREKLLKLKEILKNKNDI